MLGNHRFFVSKATVFLCTTFHISLKAKRRRSFNEDAGSLGTMCAHKEANLEPKGTPELTWDQEECQTQRAGKLATVVLGLDLDLGRGDTNRENLTRASLNQSCLWLCPE